MSNSNLPVGDPKNFIGEHEKMDLSAIKDKTFLVAISTGDREDGYFIPKTAHGPYNFAEMIEEVGYTWEEHQHHVKVIVLSKERDKPVEWLDLCTCDYIEANYMDLIAESFMEGILDSEEYTCRAGIVSAADEDDPRKAKKEEPPQV